MAYFKVVFNAIWHKLDRSMDKKKLEKANRLNNFIESNSVLIKRYCLGFDCDIRRLGYALRDIDTINPELSKDIKKTVQNAFDSIQKEFDEL